MDKTEAKIIFGENIKRLRLARNMSQEELAKALGYENRSPHLHQETPLNHKALSGFLFSYGDILVTL